MQLECIAHWDELYIRSYPLADTSAYARKLVDLPITVRLEGGEFFLSYRRDLNGQWKVFCAELQLRELRQHVNRVSPGSLELKVAEVFGQIDERCQAFLQSKPVEMTRRDALVSWIQEGQASLLLHTLPDEKGECIAYYHLGGVALVAVSFRMEKSQMQVLEVIEPTLPDWGLLCETLKENAALGRVGLDALVRRLFEALLPSSAVHIKSGSVNEPNSEGHTELRALEC